MPSNNRFSRKNRPLLERVAGRKLRNRLARDQEWLCFWCGGRMRPTVKGGLPTPDTVTLDHLKPYGKGGQTTDANCVAACYRCNNARGSRPGPPSHLKAEDSHA